MCGVCILIYPGNCAEYYVVSGVCWTRAAAGISVMLILLHCRMTPPANSHFTIQCERLRKLACMLTVNCRYFELREGFYFQSGLRTSFFKIYRAVCCVCSKPRKNILRVSKRIFQFCSLVPQPC